MSDQILKKNKKAVYERCLKFVWYMCWYMTFFGMQTVYIYTEIYGAKGICFCIRQEMTVFDCYTTGIWRPGIRIMTFFLLCYNQKNAFDQHVGYVR